MITFETALKLCGSKLIKREAYPRDDVTWLLFDVGKDKTFELLYNPSTLQVRLVCVKNSEYNYLLIDDSYYYKYVDDSSYTVLTVDEDFEEKAYAIINDIPFDNRIKVEVELTDEEWLAVALAAHEKDITLNQYFEAVLEQAIKEHHKHEADCN